MVRASVSKESHTAAAPSAAPGLDPGPTASSVPPGKDATRPLATRPPPATSAAPARRTAIAGRRCPWYHPGAGLCSGRRWRVQFGGFMYFQNRGLDTTRVYDEHLAEI